MHRAMRLLGVLERGRSLCCAARIARLPRAHLSRVESGSAAGSGFTLESSRRVDLSRLRRCGSQGEPGSAQPVSVRLSSSPSSGVGVGRANTDGGSTPRVLSRSSDITNTHFLDHGTRARPVSNVMSRQYLTTLRTLSLNRTSSSLSPLLQKQKRADSYLQTRQMTDMNDKSSSQPGEQFEPRQTNTHGSEDWTPDPSKSIKLPANRQALVDDILALYSCEPTVERVKRYTPDCVYDDQFV